MKIRSRAGSLSCVGFLLAAGAGGLLIGCREAPQPQPAPASKPVEQSSVAGARITPDPISGMYRLENKIDWRLAKLPSGIEFYFAKPVVTTLSGDWVTLTLIVGSIGKTNACVVPPLKNNNETFVPGITVEHCPHTDTDPEVVTIHRGVLCVNAVPCRTDEVTALMATHPKGNQIPIWPFILRTPAIPAGAYSGEFITLSLNLTNGVNRMYVIRPNQQYFSGSSTECAKSDAQEQKPTMEMYAHPDGGANIAMKQTSYVMMEGGKTPPTTSSPVAAPEDKFVRDTCEFFKEAMAVISKTNGDPIHFECYR